MCWPPYRPDLNPIENLWGIVKRNLYGQHAVNKLSTIGPKFIEEWNKTDNEICKKLIKSMRKRMQQVISLKGQAINF